MKILHLDIETFPNTVYTWGLWDQNIPIEMIVEPGKVACWGAMWDGASHVMFDSVHNSTQRQMLKGIHGLLNEADAVVTYNGDKFDLPWLRGDFATVGLKPIAPVKSIDLLKTVRTQFRFPSNKLQYVSRVFGIGEKVKHSGFELWQQCMAGDPAAWAKMEEYNIQDVLLLERLYNKIKGSIKNHPNHSVFTGHLVCPNCGSEHRHIRGYSDTQAGRYPRYQCTDCGKYYRGNTSVASKKKMLPL